MTGNGERECLKIKQIGQSAAKGRIGQGSTTSHCGVHPSGWKQGELQVFTSWSYDIVFSIWKHIALKVEWVESNELSLKQMMVDVLSDCISILASRVNIPNMAAALGSVNMSNNNPFG